MCVLLWFSVYATADSSGGGGDASKGCTKENPCPYDGEKS